MPGDVPALLAKLRDAGYLAGLPLGRWYPELADCADGGGDGEADEGGDRRAGGGPGRPSAGVNRRGT